MSANATRLLPRLSSSDLPLFFAPEQLALGDELLRAAPSLTDDHVGEPLVRARAAVSAMAGAGLFAHLLPTAGQRVSLRALCLVRELLGQVSPLGDAIFAVHGLGTHPIVLAGSEAQRGLLPKALRGEAVLGFALTEPNAGSDVASLQARAVRDGGDFVLDGDKTFISNVGIATHYVIFANADPTKGKRGISAFLVEANAPGLHEAPLPMSIDHPIGSLHLHGCRVPAGALLGNVGDGLKLALGTLDTFRVSVGAAAVGMSRRALDATLARVTSRQQFGKPLADQQQIQGYLAEMATDLDAARLLVLRAAHAKDAGADRLPAESAMAKMFATEAAQRIIDRAVQLHGGLGVTLGSDVERLYREIRPLRIYEGTTEIQRVIIARELLAQVTPAR